MINAQHDNINLYPSADVAVAELLPREPLYCIYRKRLISVGRRFVEGFPGKSMFAVKANPFPAVINSLWDSGIRCFDTASLPEIELVHKLHPNAELFYMNPVRIHGTVRDSYDKYGVRNFVVDHPNELARVLNEITPSDTTIFVRTAVPNKDAIYDLSTKFGASMKDTLWMLDLVRSSGAEAALAFNMGSMVMDPKSYEIGIKLCTDILHKTGLTIQKLDIGGGFPWVYPDIKAPNIEAYFSLISQASNDLPLAEGATLYCEPGRSMVADGMSLIVQVLLKKENCIYINDGVYGSFSESNISNGEVWYPTKIIRPNGPEPSQELKMMTVFGPTCDSLDKLPRPIPFPIDIAEGDWIEIGTMGGYSNSVRTAFNGFYPEKCVLITDGTPPEAIHN